MHEITMIGRTEALDQAQIVGLNLNMWFAYFGI